MIVLDTKEKKLIIIHDSRGKLKLMKSDLDAEKYVAKNIPNGRLLGTFPDPTALIDIVFEELNVGGTRKEITKGKTKSTKEKEQKPRPRVVKRTR